MTSGAVHLGLVVFDSWIFPPPWPIILGKGERSQQGKSVAYHNHMGVP